MAMIPEKCYHMNASTKGNLQQSLTTYDLMNSLKSESNGVPLLHQSEWAMMQE